MPPPAASSALHLRQLAWALSLLAVAPTLSHTQELPACDQRYDIEASLDAERHVLTGRERIHVTNHASKPLVALLFHLYPNAFRDRNSVFMREGGRRLRSGTLGRPGRVAVSALRGSDGRELLAAADRELIPGDFTQLRVNLATPLQPGAAMDLELTFRNELPEIVARSGYVGEFHMLGQWFPKLARLEPNGEFASFPYHGLGEFYADFSDYDFAITVPKAYQIAASGVRVSSALRGAQRTDRFVAKHVHDVAWAAYPYFMTRELRVEHVQVQLFAPEGYGAALDRQARVIGAALPYFERRYGRYPYAKLSVVIPPASAHRAAGMEYPTLFVSAGPFWALPAWAPDPLHDIVSVHELAHQWFAGIIASDEVRYPVLDEGLAEWAALDFLRQYYRSPPSLFATRRPPVELFELVRALFLWRGGPVPSSLLPVTSYRYETLARAVYMRPGLVFEAIAERFGRRGLQAALARYAQAQRFGHPTPRELFEAFDATLGPGFAQRVLEPALSGEQPAALRAAPQPEAAAVSGSTFSAELLFLAQAVLHWVGA